MNRFIILIVALVAYFALPAQAYEAKTLDELSAEADVILKVTALKREPVQDEWLPPAQMLGACATRFKVISVLKGEFTGEEASFHHYVDLNNSPLRYFRTAPLVRYEFTLGQSYLLWADKNGDGTLRQLSKDYIGHVSQGAIRVADDAPVQGEIKTVVWDELVKGTGSTDREANYNAFRLLSAMSGETPLRETSNEIKRRLDFPLEQFMGLIIPLFHSAKVETAFRAILAAGGTGAPMAKEELLKVADSHPKIPLRGMALYSMRSLKTTDVQEAAYRALQSVPPEITTDDAAVLQDNALRLLADFPGARARFAWRAYAAHPQTRVRCAVAYAVNEAKEGALAWLMGKMVDDPVHEVRYAAVRSLLALPPDLATATWKKRCTPDYYGQFFVNALAARNIEPYLPKLTYILLNSIRPKGGVEILEREPDYTSWHLLFDYVKSKPRTTLESARFTPLLHALENSRWTHKTPTLYRLYLTRNMKYRARALRARLDYVSTIREDFDRVDRELRRK